MRGTSETYLIGHSRNLDPFHKVFTAPESLPSPNHQHYQLYDPKTLDYVVSYLTAPIVCGSNSR